MKEFKFRAWHKRYKKMYEISDLHMATLMNGGIWATANGRNPIEDKDIKIQIQPNEINVMQYTGLKDVNGKEIYEGDIVSSFVPNRESTGAIIDYNDEITVFYDIRNTNEQFVFLLEPSIIGNIYENPELLIK